MKAMKARATARLGAALIVVAVVTGAFLRPAGAVQFTNSTPITMPALGPTVPAPWPGNPYPSTIAVSGLSGTITDVNVVLHGFDCSARTVDFAYPEDIDLLLVGPTGANSVILSDVGGQNATTANQFTDITVTLDDEAASPLPADTQLSGGTYRPLDDDDDPSERVAADTFPAPAPAPTGGSTLSVFDGTAPNGTWSLYMADDFAGPDNCRMLRGWTIDITTSEGTTTTTAAPTTTTTAPTTTTTAGQNRPPVANNDAYTTAQGTALTVPAPGVLANDTDPDGDPLTAGMPTNPSNGTLNLSTNGGFTYTPNPGFTGTDSFTYMAHDPNGGMTTATVTITVTGTTTTTTAPPTTTTTTTAPTTTTTTTTAPTTTTTAPTTTTTAPTTTTTTTAPTTTTTAPPTTTTTTTAPPTTTTTTGPGALTCDGLAATIVGTEGDDRITGTPERDVIVALGGHDMVHGMGGDDVICGGPGDDHLNGGQGNDRLLGGDGDDNLVGAAGADHHHGGRGEDVCAGSTDDGFTECESGFPAKLASASGGSAGASFAQLAVVALLVLVAVISGLPGRLLGRRLSRTG